MRKIVKQFLEQLNVSKETREFLNMSLQSKDIMTQIDMRSKVIDPKEAYTEGLKEFMSEMDKVHLSNGSSYGDMVRASLNQRVVGGFQYEDIDMETLRAEALDVFLKYVIGANTFCYNKPRGVNCGVYYEHGEYVVGIIKNSKITRMVTLDRFVFDQHIGSHISKNVSYMNYNIHMRNRYRSDKYGRGVYTFVCSDVELSRFIYKHTDRYVEDEDKVYIDHTLTHRGINILDWLRQATIEENNTHRKPVVNVDPECEAFRYKAEEDFSETGFLMMLHCLGYLTRQEAFDCNRLVAM